MLTSINNSSGVLVPILLGLYLFSGSGIQADTRTRKSFNDGWKFHRGDAAGAETPPFADSQWRDVNLPHDWAIEGPFDSKFNARAGGLPFHGTGWYRKRFRLPASATGKVVTLEFDGAMADAHVWINGHFLGNRPNGYIGFQFDLTPHLQLDAENVVAVRLSPKELSSRWYPGAGLYRNTWLETKDPIHVDHWGTFITTPTLNDDLAEVRVRSRLKNTRSDRRRVKVQVQLLDPSGQTVAQCSRSVFVGPKSTATVTQSLDVSPPQRWDIKHPNLYTAVTRILADNQVIDQTQTRFGIREIEYRAGAGFFLNGRRVQMNGVCLHHDLGPLGAAVNRRATQRQLEIMKSMGVNAIRTSHNPPSPEQLELCDELGLLVQVEAFDCWQMAKIPNGYNLFFDDWHETDLRDMIRRDRNHPAVVMWSIGNEILEQSRRDGWKLARHLHRICKDEDPTRLTSAGFNYYPASIKNGLAAEVDVPGFNYKPLAYATVSAQHPDWHLVGSETSSCVSSRGTYHLPIKKYSKHPSLEITSYDLIGPPWAYPPDIEFYYLKQSPNVIGEFVWTGFDYLGEPTPFGGRDNSTNGYWNADWPARSSYFGTVDLCGFPKDRFYLYQSQWTSVQNQPMVHILPHWDWPDKTAQTIPVYAYTNAEEAELFLNGKSLGRKKKGIDTTDLIVKFLRWDQGDFASPYRLSWEVPYEPGDLKVVAYQNGKQVAQKLHRTPAAPATVHLQADRVNIAADGKDLSFVTVRIVDADGNFCPRANLDVEFEIAGPGEIVAVGNGDPATTAPFKATSRQTFNGMALVIIRSKPQQPGSIQLRATATKLATGKVKLDSRLP